MSAPAFLTDVRVWFAIVGLVSGIPHAATAQPLPEIPYTATPLRLPGDMVLGEAAGVAATARHVYVLARTNAQPGAPGVPSTRLHQFDRRNGIWIRDLARDLTSWSVGHSVRVDPAGGIWVVDSRSDLLIRFDSLGVMQTIIGRQSPDTSLTAGRPRPLTGLFHGPTDVAFDARGNVFVADGYTNSRIVRISPEGRWTDTGAAGTGAGEFALPHSIAVDHMGNLYVADSNNERIQVFDSNLRYLREFQLPSAPVPHEPLIPDTPNSGEPRANARTPWGLCIPPGTPQTAVMFVSEPHLGRIYKVAIPDGRVLGVFGKPGRKVGEFGWVHAIACPTEHELYVAELLNWRVQKLFLSTQP